MESWRLVWRDGFVPVLSTPALMALRDALRCDDPRLLQGGTTSPPPLMCVQDWPVEAACALGFCGWQGEALDAVGEVEYFFARVCYEADQRLGEPAACRWFLNWFDDTPRREMLREFLPEVERAIEARNAGDRHAAAELLRLADDGCPHVPCSHGSPDDAREPVCDESERAPTGAVCGAPEAAADERAALALC